MRLKYYLSELILAGCFVGLVHAQPIQLTIDPVQRPIQLGIKGAPAGQYTLEQSASPGSPKSWEFLLLLTLTGASQSWVDSSSTGLPHRFYRLRSVLQPAAPEAATDFRLIDQAGKSRELNYYSTARAVVLVFVNGLDSVTPSALSAIKAIRDDFAAQGTLLWMIDSNSQSDRANVPALAKAMGIDWPVLHDRGRLVTREFGVTVVPEVVGISAADWTVFYRGAIQDRASGVSTPAGQNYLALALKNFLSGQTVAFTRTRPEGAAIAWPAAKTISYATDIAPLLLDKCVRCHSPGNIAPWSMTNHAIVKSYSHSIKQELLAGRMPPWHADPAYGEFANDNSLKPSESALLLEWIANGASRDNSSDPLADAIASKPVPADYPNAWPAELGQPDHILSIPTQSIPATGEVPYAYLQAAANVSSNVWLRAAVVLPGNKRAVHHVLVFTGSLLEIARSGGGLSGYFAAYVPGQRTLAFPEGTGKLLPRNSTLTFQMHYTTTGEEESDQTQLGLYFMKAPPSLELKTGAAATLALAIPPGDHEYESEALVKPSASRDIWLYELSPHMHLRGSRFQFEALYPNGKSEVLLSVPKYDFHWQTLYRLAEPKRLPAGTTIRCRGAFDNSAQNLHNPDPGLTIRFGEQTDDEMFIGYLNYSVIQ